MSAPQNFIVLAAFGEGTTIAALFCGAVERSYKHMTG